MQCKCGGAYEINPLDMDGLNTDDMTPGMNEVKTRTMNVFDIKKNHALLILLECPFCGSTRFKLLPYDVFLELPGPTVSDDFYTAILSKPPTGAFAGVKSCSVG